MTPGPGGCWIWTLAVKNPKRGPNLHYGVASIGGRQFHAHRLSYESVNGPIPDGMHIDHLCRTPRCIRPDHLEAVTPGENFRRGMAPAAVAVRTGKCKRGHTYEPGNSEVRSRCRICLRDNMKRLREERAAAAKADAEAVARVRALHRRVESPDVEFYGPDICRHDADTWPCATIRALDGDDQ